MMKEYNFSSKSGFCPQCFAFGRRWYIQDRDAGGGTYEYCLMSVAEEEPVKHSFHNKQELAKWLNEDRSNAEYDEALTNLIIARYVDWKADYSDRALIERHGIEYIYDKAQNTLTIIPERRKETGWYSSYRECLCMAKEVLEKHAVKFAIGA